VRSATQYEADRFTQAAVSHFGGVLVHQQAMAALIKTVLPFDLTTLMGSRAITLGPFAYLPQSFTPDQQIDVIAGSCQHLHQFFDDAIKFVTMYTASSEGRSVYQAHSMRAQVEVHFARFKTLPSLEMFADSLQGYALGESDIKLAVDILESAGTTIASGLPPSTESGSFAVNWLRREMPELLTV
jgi:hypothetical protein